MIVTSTLLIEENHQKFNWVQVIVNNIQIFTTNKITNLPKSQKIHIKCQPFQLPRLIGYVDAQSAD